MSDEIMTRNSAGELELRTVQTTGDTGNDKNDVLTRDSRGRLCVRTTGSGGGSGGKNYDAEIEALDNAVSVLSTSVDLSAEIGGKTTVALADLSAMDIDGRPSYKRAGATVYAENGVVGIIDSVDSTNAIITTVSTSASVEKGHTWTQVPLINPDSGSAEVLVTNLGSLSDGEYEFLIKNPNISYGGQYCFLLRFKIVNGNLDKDEYGSSSTCFYTPMVALSRGGNEGYFVDLSSSSLPTFFDKIGDSFVYASNVGYADGVAGTVTPINCMTKYFEVSDIKNVETGEFLPFESAVVYTSSDWDQYSEENQFATGQWYRGTNPFYKNIDLTQIYTASSTFAYSHAGCKYVYVKIPTVCLDLSSTTIEVENNYYYNAFPRGFMVTFYDPNSPQTNGDFLSIKGTLTFGAEDCKILKATGVFANIKSVELCSNVWDREGGYLFFELENPITTTHKEHGVVYSMYGVAYYNGVNMGFSEEIGSEFVKIKDLLMNKIPTSTSSEYVLTHENGLVEMGGVVSVNETLQPDVAFGNIPVVFPNELANANFVPTITVMTDGTFKQVMADVANPTTTGFDLCVRNVDTEAVSNIKIAWKIVGTKK